MPCDGRDRFNRDALPVQSGIVHTPAIVGSMQRVLGHFSARLIRLVWVSECMTSQRNGIQLALNISKAN